MIGLIIVGTIYPIESATLIPVWIGRLHVIGLIIIDWLINVIIIL